MPHLVIEHSAEISETHDIQSLCDTLFDQVAVHPAVTNPAALRVRFVPFSTYRLGVKEQSFAHATLHVLPGRDAETKSSLVQTILKVLVTALPEVGSLSVDLVELNAAYDKRML